MIARWWGMRGSLKVTVSPPGNLVRVARAHSALVDFLCAKARQCNFGLPDVPGQRHLERCNLRQQELAQLARRQFGAGLEVIDRSEEHTSELQSLMRISYAVLCLKKKNHKTQY